MARLSEGEKDRRTRKLIQLLQLCRLGLTEKEIAEETGLDRRTVNNYLRQLDDDERAYREGRKWFLG